MSTIDALADPVDWTIPQPLAAKGISPRGRSLVRGAHKYRNRRHQALSLRYESDGRTSRGERMAARVRGAASDLIDEVLDFFVGDEEEVATQPTVGYSRCARNYQRKRRKEDEIEIEERQCAILDGIEQTFRAQACELPARRLILQAKINWVKGQLNGAQTDEERVACKQMLVEAEAERLGLQVLELYAA